MKQQKLLQKAMDEDLLDKEVKNWKLLSQSWFLAQYDDNAIIALREAAKIIRRWRIRHKTC